MTYINTGATIDLGQSTVLVLDYLNSCVRETITGGVVHVGVPISQVDNGSFKNARLACDAGNLASAAVASQGGVVYRALGDPLLIRSTDPIFVAATAGTLVITEEGETDSPKIQCRSPITVAAVPSRLIFPRNTRRFSPASPTAPPWATVTSSSASPRARAAIPWRPCSASCRSEFPVLSRRLRTVLAAAIVVLASTFAMLAPGSRGGISGLSTDTLFWLRQTVFGPRATAAQSPIALILIDENSYDTFKDLPKDFWAPFFGAAISAVDNARAKLIGFDILLPLSIAGAVQSHPELGLAPTYDAPYLTALFHAAITGKLVMIKGASAPRSSRRRQA